MTQQSILIVGADGMIGRALEQRLRDGCRSVVSSSRRPDIPGRLHLDLAQPIDASRLPPNIVTAYLLAAMTSMAACEADLHGSRRINVEYTLDLARALHDRGAHIVVVSTNLVLDGSTPRAPACAPLAPVNAYARQKVELEQGLATFGGNTAILRTTKIAESLTGLLTHWRTSLVAGEVIRPFRDLVCAPLPLAYMVEALTRIGDQRAVGLYQISADQDMSYAAIATVLAEAIGGSAPDRVREATAREMGVTLPACPDNTTLDSVATEAKLGLAPVVAAEVVSALTARIASGG